MEAAIPDETPFVRYAGAGRVLLGRPGGGDGSCRRGYGLPVLKQCGHLCAYCGRDLGSVYESWLDISVDHVVPVEAISRLAYPSEWVMDLANLVTACRACNEFLNGYRLAERPPGSLAGFFEIRDRCFLEKRERAVARHARERSWYRHWYGSIAAGTAGS